jgi:LPXTG-site transpeptidase (sortase) family protein
MEVGRSIPAAFGGGIRRFPAMRMLWLACVIGGLFLLANFAVGMFSGYSEQQRLNQQWQAEMRTQPPTPQEISDPPAVVPPIDPTLRQPKDGIDFAIRVPKLNYFAAVKEGVDAGVLYSSPGRYPSTVWPGDQGMVGVAAHNVYWINFPQLATGDEVDIETRYGLFRYRVTGNQVVNADNRTVLVHDADGYHLTLTTCWPTWAGAFAKQRYVIFTEQVWPVPPRPHFNQGLVGSP